MSAQQISRESQIHDPQFGCALDVMMPLRIAVVFDSWLRVERFHSDSEQS